MDLFFQNVALWLSEISLAAGGAEMCGGQWNRWETCQGLSQEQARDRVSSRVGRRGEPGVEPKAGATSISRCTGTEA